MVSPFGVAVRIFIYVAVIGGSACVLYGVGTSQHKIPGDNYGGSSCLLFAKAGKDWVHGGATGWCKFIEFAAASQLGLALLMAIITVVRLIRRGADGNKPSFSSLVELFFVTPAFIIAVAGGSILSAGLALLCSRLHDNWPTDYKPPCSKLLLYVKDGNLYKFYNDLNIAQIGMWVTCAWLFHVLLSIYSTRKWMRKSRTSSGLTESSAFASNEGYKKLGNPAAM